MYETALSSVQLATQLALQRVQLSVPHLAHMISFPGRMGAPPTHGRRPAGFCRSFYSQFSKTDALQRCRRLFTVFLEESDFAFCCMAV